MFDDDYLCRSVHFPRFFQAGIFDIAVLLRFEDPTKTDNYGLSVGSRYLLQDVNGAHKYGCRVAVAKNKRFAQRNGQAPEPMTEAQHYLGFYDIRVGDVRSVRLDHYDLALRWRPENDEDSHFQIELDRKASTPTAKQLKRDRRVATALLELCLSGPYRHVCDVDKGIKNELTAVALDNMNAQRERLNDPSAYEGVQ